MIHFQLFKKKQRKAHEGYGFERYSKKLPKIVEDTISILERKEAFKEEGLFRVSGDLKEIHAIKKRYDRSNSFMFHAHV